LGDGVRRKPSNAFLAAGDGGVEHPGVARRKLADDVLEVARNSGRGRSFPLRAGTHFPPMNSLRR
jgi:hypothetical protein